MRGCFGHGFWTNLRRHIPANFDRPRVLVTCFTSTVILELHSRTCGSAILQCREGHVRGTEYLILVICFGRVMFVVSD